MRKYIIMVSSLIFFSLVFLISNKKVVKMESNNPKIQYTADDILVNLSYNEQTNEIFCSFYNNLSVIQYVPKCFIDIFKEDENGKICIINDEILIKDDEDNFMDYLVIMQDIDIENIKITDCYKMNIGSSIAIGGYKIDKIVDIQDIGNKKIKFQYDGLFGKSNVLEVNCLK